MLQWFNKNVHEPSVHKVDTNFIDINWQLQQRLIIRPMCSSFKDLIATATVQ